MSGLSDYAIAAQMRDVIARTVAGAVEAARPRYRYATVVSIDRLARKCVVQYPGEPGTVSVNMGNIQPKAAGQVVRVEGLTGDRYIGAVMGVDSSWYQPWGLVVPPVVVTPGTAFDATTPTQLTYSNWPCVGGRHYELKIRARFRSSVDNTLTQWKIEYADSVFGGAWTYLDDIQITTAWGTAAVITEDHQFSAIFSPAWNWEYDFRIVSSRISAAASTTTPVWITFEIHDIGANPYQEPFGFTQV